MEVGLDEVSVFCVVIAGPVVGAEHIDGFVLGGGHTEEEVVLGCKRRIDADAFGSEVAHFLECFSDEAGEVSLIANGNCVISSFDDGLFEAHDFGGIDRVVGGDTVRHGAGEAVGVEAVLNDGVVVAVDAVLVLVEQEGEVLDFIFVGQCPRIAVFFARSVCSSLCAAFADAETDAEGRILHIFHGHPSVGVGAGGEQRQQEDADAQAEQYVELVEHWVYFTGTLMFMNGFIKCP